MSIESKTDPNLKIDAVDIKTELNSQAMSQQQQQQQPPSQSVNSVFEPQLISTVEDINKYYKPDLLYRLTGIDLNEVT
jgi:hypothetical protein